MEKTLNIAALGELLIDFNRSWNRRRWNAFV